MLNAIDAPTVRRGLSDVMRVLRHELQVGAHPAQLLAPRPGEVVALEPDHRPGRV